MMDSDLDQLIYNVLLTRIMQDQPISDLVSISDIDDLVSTAKLIFNSEPMMLRLDFPIQVVGDIHGNIDDLLRIFERCGYPPKTTYLFLGDYVDRGPASVEVILLLLALKCKYPSHINMLRGNHETAPISRAYGFANECENKYNSKVFTKFTTVFSVLPIAAVLEDLIFCVHGGISPSLHDIELFETLPKPKEIYTHSIFSDLLWSDPRSDVDSFQVNQRGCGVYFNEENLRDFLQRNGLCYLFRSHEECYDGYEWNFEDELCLTIFSNSDYCGHGNTGAVIGIPKDLVMTKELFKPLTEEEKIKRRVIFPEWLMSKVTSPQDKLPISFIEASSSQPEVEFFDEVVAITVH
ncbi:Serine/threonine-protein phosphatase PP1-2 [Tritrichomonas foetus]|uniref:Serine/threonine-protein phosphatase n=1 Tax=Tritrichomonas foetus TaxID=1144522 RepID=A0A1J4KZT9_9EUKA|nr:Serine/threonine-protein phosphatase PP1-2 [Tritrichomonas foetus]|eukprot:OHT16763.1 Serine/threonine-protein phosphatase PP1-2 [Tritrichomonas foetus]